MKRKEFLKMCALLGIGVPLQAGLTSCSTNTDEEDNTIGKVIIIGAGAAGMTAGHLLKQRGIDFEILEASSVYGGRMKRTNDFANFPIPLGAEWLHVGKGVLDDIVNDQSTTINVQTTLYDPDEDTVLYEGEEASLEDIDFTIDQKFINSTWFDFFEEYILPSVESRIRYNQVIQSIDYSQETIIVRTAEEEFQADKVIVTVPVKLLQNGAIQFTPELPESKKEALENITVWDGCKAFIEFSEKFYPTFIGYDVEPESAGQKLYYDASYGQSTSQNILGLFAVGTATLPYVQLSDEALKDHILQELDDLFEGQASANYVKHIFQNWNEEPYANGAYVNDTADWNSMRTLGESVDNKLYFAGDGYYNGTDWSSVHSAARSAIRAVDELE